MVFLRKVQPESQYLTQFPILSIGLSWRVKRGCACRQAGIPLINPSHSDEGVIYTDNIKSEVLLLAPKNLLKKNIDLNKDWKYNKEQKANPYGSLRFGALYLLFWVLPLLPKILAGK